MKNLYKWERVLQALGGWGSLCSEIIQRKQHKKQVFFPMQTWVYPVTIYQIFIKFQVYARGFHRRQGL